MFTPHIMQLANALSTDYLPTLMRGGVSRSDVQALGEFAIARVSRSCVSKVGMSDRLTAGEVLWANGANIRCGALRRHRVVTTDGQIRNIKQELAH